MLKLIIALAVLSGLLISCYYLPKTIANTPLKEALFYQKLSDKVVQCQLCPRRCAIPNNLRGFCGVRENHDGTLYTLVYAKPVAVHIDPIEKKPLFHFLPSSSAFSVATAGCNLKCKFCQNWQISQGRPEQLDYTYIEPADLIKKAKESGCASIAYTYSEPTIFYEYMLETAKLAKEQGIRNIMHSCGYINEEPLRQLAKYLDGANIDLKGFTNDYYVKMTEATLEPVLKSLLILKESGVHLEITNLLLPGYNDDADTLKKMCLWIKENLGQDTPLHFSRFFPMYKLTSLNPTPVEALEKAREVAVSCGLRYVYIGNIPEHSAENTICPYCKSLLVERRGYFIVQNNIENGRCKYCKKEISGVWK